MNIQKRLNNKTFILAFAGVVIGFIYQICGVLGFIPPISEDVVNQLVGLVVTILVGLGVLIDPTTTGIKDIEK